jgi:hypothetical protein
VTTPDVDITMQPSHFSDEPDLKMINEAYRLRTIDRVKSFLVLEGFAAKGSKISIRYISSIFTRGVDLNDIIEKAKYWNERAKEAHLSDASYRFGLGFYRLGDYSSAFDAFSWGTADGYAPSIYRLGNMYLLGIHVEKDFDRSRELLELAAKKGNVFAKKDFGHILLTKNFGIFGKIRVIFIFYTIIYYQFYFIYRKIRNIPLDERYFC